MRQANDLHKEKQTDEMMPWLSTMVLEARFSNKFVKIRLVLNAWSIHSALWTTPMKEVAEWGRGS